MAIKELFALEKKPLRGLMTVEWLTLAYLLLTLVLMAVLASRLHEPASMLLMRLRVVGGTALLWGLYRVLPCRLTRLLRVAGQMTMLAWWYPDTYEFNRLFPNLDHLFAHWEQTAFGCQPALLFCEAAPWPVFSELMDFGYAAYFPMILVVVLFFFFFRYKDFARASFVILASFYIYYVVFIILPVTGPQYYYKAVGTETVAEGRFPDVGNHFETLREPLDSPGYADGFFHHIVKEAHEAGERPTAAFPSSHVGISTILLLLVWRTHGRHLLSVLIPVYALLCLSTVYIYAHYAIDVVAGWLSALLLYAMLSHVKVKD